MTCCGGGALLYSSKNEKISIEKNDKETYRSTIMVDIYGWLWLWYAIIVAWNANISNKKKERIKNFTGAPADVSWWICDHGGSMLDDMSW